VLYFLDLSHWSDNHIGGRHTTRLVAFYKIQYMLTASRGGHIPTTSQSRAWGTTVAFGHRIQLVMVARNMKQRL
jgi:hypothetical protein